MDDKDSKTKLKLKHLRYTFVIALIILTGVFIIAIIRKESITFIMALLIMIAHEYKWHR